jgi:hypothetical protein
MDQFYWSIKKRIKFTRLLTSRQQRKNWYSIEVSVCERERESMCLYSIKKRQQKIDWYDTFLISPILKFKIKRPFFFAPRKSWLKLIHFSPGRQIWPNSSLTPVGTMNQADLLGESVVVVVVVEKEEYALDAITCHRGLVDVHKCCCCYWR